MSRRIAVIGDMHSGSEFALFPKRWVSLRGSVRLPNPAQEIIYNHWVRFWEKDGGKECDTVWLLGDICEGNNPKQTGRDTITNLEEQVEIAVDLLGPYAVGKKVIGINGSGYHQAPGQSLDEQVVRKLGGDFRGPIATGEIEGTGKVANLVHSSGGAVIYRETAAAREGIFADAAEALGKIERHIDLMVRGHWHWLLAMKNESRWAVYTPAWKLIFDWVKITGMWFKHLSMLGAVILTFDEEGIRPLDRIYEPPKLLDKMIPL